MNEVMLDLETLGLGNDAVILGVGAVIFRRAEPAWQGDHFRANVNLDSCMAVGMRVDYGTWAFWMRQSDEARKALFEPEPISLSHMLHLFDFFYRNNRAERLWSHVTFDTPKLEHAYRALGKPQPWHYRDTRDLRTICDLAFGKELPTISGEPGAIDHEPLGDAVRMTKLCQAAYTKLRVEGVSV